MYFKRVPKMLFLTGVFTEEIDKAIADDDKVGSKNVNQRICGQRFNCPIKKIKPIPQLYSKKTQDKYIYECSQCHKSVYKNILFIPLAIFRDGFNDINMMYCRTELYCSRLCINQYIDKKYKSYFDNIEKKSEVNFLIDALD